MNAKQYIREVLERSCLPKAERKKIKKDLEIEVFSALERGENMEEIIERMGSPEEVAAGLFENFIEIPARPFREYKSKKTLFGLPLVHIIRGSYAPSVQNTRSVSTRGFNVGGRYRNTGFSLPTARGIFAFGPKAKGVFAVGNLSAGFISIGNVSTGILSIGNLSAGLFSIANVSLGLLISFGNVAAGLLSAGNLSVGYAAAGNLALGEYALGNKAVGTFIFSITNLPAQFEQIKLFFSEMDAGAPVGIFYSIVREALEIIMNPVAVMPIAIISGIVLAVVVVTLCIAPKKLLNESDYN